MVTPLFSNLCATSLSHRTSILRNTLLISLTNKSWVFTLSINSPRSINLNSNMTPMPAGGTPIHYLYGYVPPNGVAILKLLISNGVSISGSFSRTGYNIWNARKLQFCKQPFELIQWQIAFKNTVQCVNKQTVVLLLHPRTEYKKLAHF